MKSIFMLVVVFLFCSMFSERAAHGLDWNVEIGPNGGINANIGAKQNQEENSQGASQGENYASYPVYIGNYGQPAQFQGHLCFNAGANFPNGAIITFWERRQQFQTIVQPGVVPPGTCY